MSKYEKAFTKILRHCNTELLQEKVKIVKELVEKEQNGIYISNEKASELLEALGMLDKQELKLTKGLRAGAILKYKLSKVYPELYNKLKAALGGNDER